MTQKLFGALASGLLLLSAWSVSIAQTDAWPQSPCGSW